MDLTKLYEDLIDIVRDTSIIKDMCEFTGQTTGRTEPIYRRATDATNKLACILKEIEKECKVK